MVQSAPRIPWAVFKDVLTQVIGGVVRVDLEYVTEGREGAERPPLRVDVDLVLFESASSGLLHRKS